MRGNEAVTKTQDMQARPNAGREKKKEKKKSKRNMNRQDDVGSFQNLRN